jgi:hypothetical protein
VKQFWQAHDDQKAHWATRGWSFFFRDRVCVPVLLLAGFAVGLVYLFQFVAPDWYVWRSTTGSRSFVTAVMVGLGHGLVQPASVSPELDDFLWQKTMTLAPSAVPADTEVLPPNHWEQRHRYLLSLIGIVWRVTGVNWNVLKVILAAAFALTLVLAYALLRQGMGPALAFFLAIAFVATPGWIDEISSVRDFLKVPFLLAVFSLLAWLLRRNPSGGRLIACAFGLGALIGIGVGFRHDVIVCLPPAVLLLAVPTGGPWRQVVFQRAAALIVFAAALLITGAPVLRAYQNSGAPAHDAIMGLAPKNEDRLGLDRGFYHRMPSNIDNLVHAVERGYARRVLEEEKNFSYDGERAEAIAKEMLWTMAVRFPADFLARSYAAVLWVLEGACPDYTYAVDSVFQRPFNRWVMVPLALTALAVLLVSNARIAILAGLVFLYFCAYITIQFEHRHAYHLAIFSLWILGFLASCLIGAKRSPLGIMGTIQQADQRRLRLVLIVAIAIPSVAALSLVGARIYQAHAADRWLAPYEQATITPVATEPCASEGWIFFRAIDYSLAHKLGDGWFYQESYLVAELAGDPDMRPFCILYRKSPDSGVDFTECLYTPATPAGDAGAMRVFLPVYLAGENAAMLQMEFAGIALREEDAADFKGLYAVEDLHGFDLMPVVWLPHDRDLFVPYQRLQEPRLIARDWISPQDLPCEGVTLKSHIFPPPGSPDT